VKKDYKSEAAVEAPPKNIQVAPNGWIMPGGSISGAGANAATFDHAPGSLPVFDATAKGKAIKITSGKVEYDKVEYTVNWLDKDGATARAPKDGSTTVLDVSSKKVTLAKYLDLTADAVFENTQRYFQQPPFVRGKDRVNQMENFMIDNWGDGDIWKPKFASPIDIDPSTTSCMGYLTHTQVTKTTEQTHFRVTTSSTNVGVATQFCEMIITQAGKNNPVAQLQVKNPNKARLL
jgi:hypothetical protein